jgi:hypothetical protein
LSRYAGNGRVSKRVSVFHIISVHPLTTDQTTKRLLIGSVLLVYIVASAAFLGTVGTLDSNCLHASFGSVPGDLLGNVGKVGGAHVGIHGSSLVLHRGNRQVFIGDLRARVVSKALEC